MSYNRSPEDIKTGARSLKSRDILLVLLFIVFVAGGFYSGIVSLPRWMGTSPRPFDLAVLPANFNPKRENAPDWKNKERVNILLLGIDRRSVEDREMPSRTDTMMLLTFDPYSKTAGVLSIPRDLWVPISLWMDGRCFIPQVTQERSCFITDRINTANVYGQIYKYPGGGMALSKDTVQYNLGVKVHYYVLIDFEGFERIVDAMGGITLDVKSPLIDYEYPTPDFDTMKIYIPAGVQHLDGERTLWYARSRHQDSDFGRMARQQDVLIALREKAIQLDMIPKLPQLSQEFRESVQTDLTLSEVVTLAMIGKEIKGMDVAYRSIDTEYATPIIGWEGAEILLPKRESIRDLVGEMFFDARLQAEEARVRILNGTNTLGLAAKTASQLREKGFTEVTIGDAEDGKLYRLTQILYSSGKSYSAKLIGSLLGIPKERITDGLPSENGVDIMVILGEDARVP